MKINARVDVQWNPAAFDRLEREVTEKIRRRLESVRCPVHGTRVEVRAQHIHEGGEFCCDRLRQAIDAAIR